MIQPLKVTPSLRRNRRLLAHDPGCAAAPRPWALEFNAFGVFCITLLDMLTAQQIMDRLHLVPLAIEGGYFRETYRSTLTLPTDALPAMYGGDRNVSTAIYYLLTPDTFSVIHRVTSDEVFHFYAGDPVEMLQLWPDGSERVVIIHNDLSKNCEPQVVVPAGVWQGCRLVSGGNWALMGCTVAPGFDYADFELADRADLLALSPAHSDLIAALTKD